MQNTENMRPSLALRKRRQENKSEIFCRFDNFDISLHKRTTMDNQETTHTFIDLFSGCGGLSLGFEMAGYKCLLAIDNWKDALTTYTFNNPEVNTLCADLSSISPKEISKRYGLSRVDVIVGGPPCQGFSVAGKRDVNDKRNELYKSFVEFVKTLSPKAFVMENVPNILSMGNGTIKDSIVKDFENLGYNVVYKVLTASNYGVPQKRRRAVFVGMKDGRQFQFPDILTNTPITSKDAISDLPEHSLPEGTAYTSSPSSDYQRLMRDGSSGIYNHDATEHEQKTKEIIALVPDGGNYKDLPEELQQTRKVHIAWTRMNSNKPSMTIDTGHRHHFHYQYNRIPTVRESARIQSFPDKYVFKCSKTSQYKQVGNAVPPLLAKTIAVKLKESLDGNNNALMNGTGRQPNIYNVPEEFYFRLHHVRPRFKNDVENVLLYIANVCSNLDEAPIKTYNANISDAIRMYPGNESVANKTIQNWRTEIAALFGFYIEDKRKGTTKTGNIAKFLSSSGDLIQFFKFFLLKFQYPGGHIKAKYAKEIIDARIKFKPAQYILKVLHEADAYTGKPLGISKAEATHCIFNDLRVIRDNRDVEEVIDLIITNRKKRLKYNSSGDVIRYAGDILDYMVLANLLKESHNYYYINRAENESIQAIISDTDSFHGYDRAYQKNLSIQELSAIETTWFEYVNTGLDVNLFKTDIGNYIHENDDETDYLHLIREKIEEVINTSSTKEIGDLGEAIVIGHEKVRVKEGGREDLIHLIKKIPTSFAVGYDIQSVELDQRKRFIEVKTTISNKPINFYSFHMTPNEWDTASSTNDRYFVYRLMISRKEMTIYILQDPVGLYKKDKINMTPRNGAEISFNVSVCEKTKLLIWQE